MTPEKLKAIISQGEGTEVELKEPKDSLARKVYESICAFLNRRGGHVVLGVDNDRNVVGINPSKVQEQLDQLAKDMNNPQLFKPTYYLNFEPMDIDGKKGNIPYVYGHIDLQTMRPHRKNPKIAKVFSQMGIVEELGSGMRKMFKYTPLYANGKEPVIEEQDVYRIEIPYIPTLQGSTFDTTQKSTQKSTQKILDLILENPYVTTQETADSIGIIRRTVAKHIRSLQNQGIIKRVGPDKGGHWEVID